MTPDLTPQSEELYRNPYGLVLLSAQAGDGVRRALWAVLGACETLYWVGPLADKPVVDGDARCWLLECPPDERHAGYRSVCRRDPHAIHIVGTLGPDDATFFTDLVRGALAGFVIIVEVDAGDVDALPAGVARFGVDPSLVEAALTAGIGADGQLSLLRRRS
jgi:hypothetical protein